MNHKKRTYGWLMAVLGTALLAAVLLGLCFGSTPLNIGQVLKGLLCPGSNSVESRILWVVRLPHVAGCALAGCALAVSGLLLQIATGNPLAGPNVIGVNAGAGFALVLGLSFAPMAYSLQPLLAFCGAFGCSLAIVFISRWVGGSKVTLVLSGVAVSALLSAGISALRLLYPDRTQGYTVFSVGGVDGVGFDRMAVPALITLAVILCTAFVSPRLDLLCLGDDLASALGVRVKRIRILALLMSSAAAAAAVSFAGLLGFVGLMVPHMARRMVGQGSSRRLLWVSALLGASLVILADLLGRVLFAPSQLPAGIVTAAIGAPFFFGLLMRRRNGM